MMLSYALDSYRDDLAFTLFKQLLFIIAGVILLSWIPAIWLAKYLSRPLVSLEKHVKRISKQDWDDPVIVDRKDEIGKLTIPLKTCGASWYKRMKRKERSCKISLMI